MAGLSDFGRWCQELRRDPLPELPEMGQTIYWLVADYNRRVDAFNRDSGNPMRFITSLGKDLIDAGLISATRTTALKYESSPLKVICRR